MKYLFYIYALLLFGCKKPKEKVLIYYPSFEISLGDSEEDVLKKTHRLYYDNSLSDNNISWYSGDTVKIIEGEMINEHIICVFKNKKLNSFIAVLRYYDNKSNCFPKKAQAYFKKSIKELNLIDIDTTYYGKIPIEHFKDSNEVFMAHLHVYHKVDSFNQTFASFGCRYTDFAN